MLKSETGNWAQFTKILSYESMKFRTPAYQSTKFRARLFFWPKSGAKRWFLLVGPFPIKLGTRNAQIRNRKSSAIYENAIVQKYKISYAAILFLPKSGAKRWFLLVGPFPIKLGSRNAQIRNLPQVSKMRPYESTKLHAPPYRSTEFSERLVCFSQKAAYFMAKPWVLLVGSFPIKLGSQNGKIRYSKIAATYENATVR